MKLLFQTAFGNRKHQLLIIFIIMAMILATIASQLEIFALGVITQKGPDVFELFGAVHQGTIVPAGSLSLADIAEKWPLISGGESQLLTKEKASEFITAHKKSDWIAQAFSGVEEQLGIFQNLGHLAIFLVAIALFKALSMFVHRYATKIASIKISADLRQKYFEHIQTLPMSFYQRYNMGSLSSRVVGDASAVAEAVNACLVNYLQTPFTIVSTLTLCFLTSWELSIFIFLGFPLILLPIAFLSKGVKRISKQIQGNQEKFASVLLDFIGGIQTVKIFGMEEFSLKKYQEQNDKIAQLEKRSARYDLSSRPIVHTIAMVFLSIALVYGLFILHMNVSEVFFFCGMLYLFYEPIKKFAEENSHIQRGAAAAERMLEVMALKPDFEDDPNAVPLASFEKSISFQDVWFRYQDEWILKGVSFEVQKGQTVAIVGPTGAGKSTIVQLIPRLYEAQKGDILIDGLSLKAYSQKTLREKIGFVPQKPFLFMDSIAANISYGQPFNLPHLQEAARKAHAIEFIEKLSLKYQTPVIEGGKNLSGGQQQRLAIARALFKKAPILIMDEATSSLDAVSEDQIKQALHHLKGEITQIIIAHRLSTIEDADKIIFLNEGKKMDEGTKDELLARCAPFRKMWELLHNQDFA